MKIAFDEHIGPSLVEAIKALLQHERRSGGVELVMSKTYAEPPAQSDVPWLRKFVEDGGDVVITGDKKMRSRLHEQQALTELGLIVFWPPKEWNNWQLYKRSAYLLLWWPEILERARSSRPGDCWAMGPSMSENVGVFKNVSRKDGKKSRALAQ